MFYFVTKQMLEDIVLLTNIHIHAHKDKFPKERDTNETGLTDIDALFGILVMAGLKKIDLSIRIHQMWIDDICGVTMSKRRFFFLQKALKLIIWQQ